MNRRSWLRSDILYVSNSQFPEHDRRMLHSTFEKQIMARLVRRLPSDSASAKAGRYNRLWRPLD